MINLTKEQAEALGFSYPMFDREDVPVEIDEVKGATIAGLYTDCAPQREGNDDGYGYGPMLIRIVLVLTDGRIITLTEGGQTGYISADFTTDAPPDCPWAKF